MLFNKPSVDLQTNCSISIFFYLRKFFSLKLVSHVGIACTEQIWLSRHHLPDLLHIGGDQVMRKKRALSQYNKTS